ncbi:MAG: DNA (cytosine-5-)-methyltransferase [Propionivibrio sp.]|nr:DNA (cytosine-5-)-methyltransferase [Propionivibrio sp.]
MVTVLRTSPDHDLAMTYLAAALKHHKQAAIARHLGVDARTVRRWEVRQSVPRHYIFGLQRLLPLDLPVEGEASFRFIDLFAGIGGIRRAFEDIGGRCVFTSEWDSYAQKTYAENFPGGHAINGDITQIDAAEIPDHDLLLAGFPCQPFSIAGVSMKNALGRAHGFACETQGTLFFDVARIIDAKRPRAFLLENVKNLVSHDKGRTFDVICGTLRDELGYHIHTRVIDGAHFVPQHRERILIVGFREAAAFDFDALPLPAKGTHRLAEILHKTDGSEPQLPWDGERFFNHAARCVDPRYTLTDKLWSYLQAYAAKHRAAGNGFGFGLVYPDSVTRTLSARYYKDGSEILVYQGEGVNPRRLTPRECTRLMGFPDSFRIPVSDTRAYQLFSQAAVVPMIEAAAKLMVSSLTQKEEVTTASVLTLPKDIMSSDRWTKEQLKVAFHLYCQLPFGKLHSRNPEIIELAKLIGRTPSAVAMKLVNFASLDPAITGTGRRGLGNASALDRIIWEEFHADWEGLALECEQLRQQLGATTAISAEDEQVLERLLIPGDYTGETRRVVTEQRIKQHFFRRAVLSSYRGRCCMSGLSEPRLLIASHIVPWSKDKANRLNPSNGLCLSALHDRAFDKGLISLTEDWRIVVSVELRKREETFVKQVLLPLEGQQIELPERFLPDHAFLVRHQQEVFLDSLST